MDGTSLVVKYAQIVDFTVLKNNVKIVKHARLTLHANSTDLRLF